MYEKFELTDEDIQKYKLNAGTNHTKYGHGRVRFSRAIKDTKSDVILAELSVNYSLLPDRLFVLHFLGKRYEVYWTRESNDPYIVRLRSGISSLDDGMTEYDYAVVIRDSIAAYNSFYMPDNAWYCVTLTNSNKAKPKSDKHKLHNIIQSMCLYAKQNSKSYDYISRHLISRITGWGYGQADLDNFIESGEYRLTLKNDALQFIEYWIQEGKNIIQEGKNIEGQYSGIKPLIEFNFLKLLIKVIEIYN